VPNTGEGLQAERKIWCACFSFLLCPIHLCINKKGKKNTLDQFVRKQLTRVLTYAIIVYCISIFIVPKCAYKL